MGKKGPKRGIKESDFIGDWFKDKERKKKDTDKERQSQKRKSASTPDKAKETERKQKDRDAATTPQKQAAKERARKGMGVNRAAKPTPEKEAAKEINKKGKRAVRAAATTPEKDAVKEIDKKGKRAVRAAATTPEKEAVKEIDKRGKRAVRAAATTPEKEAVKEIDKKGKRAVRAAATTPEKEAAKEIDKKGKRAVRAAATTPEKEAAKEIDKKGKRAVRAAATTPEKEAAKEINKKGKKKNRSSEVSADKRERRGKDRKRHSDAFQAAPSSKKKKVNEKKKKNEKKRRSRMSDVQREQNRAEQRARDRKERLARIKRLKALLEKGKLGDEVEMGIHNLDLAEAAKDGAKTLHFTQSHYFWKECDNCKQRFPGLSLHEVPVQVGKEKKKEKWCALCRRLYDAEMRKAKDEEKNERSRRKKNKKKSKQGKKTEKEEPEERTKRLEAHYKFTAENNMDPGDVPEFMQDMTIAEGLLVARSITMLSVYKLRLGQFGYSGNVITFPQDVQPVVDSLPRSPADLKIMVYRKHGAQGGHKDFFVRREKVSQALHFLQRENEYYRNIKIDQEMIDSLPEEGEIEIPSFEEEDVGDEELNAENGAVDEDDVEFPVDMRDVDIVAEGNVDQKDKTDDQLADEKGVELLMHSALPTERQIRTETEQKEQEFSELLEDGPIDWPPIGSEPVNEFKERGLLVMAFPLLFPYGKCDLNDAREIKVEPIEYFRHLLLYKDQRFARDFRFRYVALNIILRRRALGKGRVFVDKNPEKDLTIDELRRMNKAERQQLLQGVMRYSASLPGSKHYWYNRRQELLRMIKQRGLPTLFFTLSSADLQWPDLHRLMPEYKSKMEAVNENPLLCAWFFIERVKLLLDVMKRDLNMKDYWGRFEWQHRGSIHFHGLAWLEGAPNVESMDLKSKKHQREIIDYFESILSCDVPCDPDSIPTVPKNPASIPYFRVEDKDFDYLGLVVYCHTHKCKPGFCQRMVNEKMECRFGFPKKKLAESEVTTQKNEKTGKESFDLLLKRNHTNVNSHNRLLAQTNRSNTDAQPIIDLHKVVTYVTKYVCKPEPKSDMMKQLMSGAIDSKFAPVDPVRQLAQRLLIRCVGDRDYSSQETVHYLMGYDQYKASRTFISLYLNAEKLDRELSNAGGKANLKKGRVETYMERDKQYEGCSLFTFYRDHNVMGTKVTKRDKEAIVVPINLRRVNEQSPLYERYCSHYLMFYKPFRKLADLKGQSGSYVEEFQSFLKENGEERCGAEDAVEEADADRESKDEDAVEEAGDRDARMTEFEFACLLQQNPDLFQMHLTSDYDWTFECQDKLDAYNGARSFAQRVMDDIDPYEAADIPDSDTSLLNKEQLEVYDAVEEHLGSPFDRTPPLRYIVTGTAGTGKSYLINCLRGLLKEQVLVIGPTGVCASNIQGQTVHSALRIPIQEFKDMRGPGLEKLQERWKNIKYVILEEMSMVGLSLFNKIDRRLRQIFPSSCDATDRELFGGRSVIMFGDFGQLAPTADVSLFRQWKPGPKSKGGQDQNRLAGRFAYKQFNRCTILKKIVRQEGEQNKQFREILQRIRRGNILKTDYRVLEERFIKNGKIPPREKEKWKDAVRLFSRNKKVLEYNLECLQSLSDQGKRVAAINADHVGGAVAKKAGYDDCGLESSLLLCEGAKVMLTANISVQQGLCNGTMGTVKKIVYLNGGPPNLPTCVLCEFPGYRGPGFDGQPYLFPVIPISRRFTYCGVECQRTALPLRLAWAVTIHKAQGLTLDKAIIDIGDREFSNGLTFVALSRVRSMDDFLLVPFDFQRLKQLGEPVQKKRNPKGGKQPGKCAKHRLHYLREEDDRLQRMEKGLEASLLSSSSSAGTSKRSRTGSQTDNTGSQTESADDYEPKSKVRRVLPAKPKAKKRLLPKESGGEKRQKLPDGRDRDDEHRAWSDDPPEHIVTAEIPPLPLQPEGVTSASIGKTYLAPIKYKPGGTAFKFKPLGRTVRGIIQLHIGDLSNKLKPVGYNPEEPSAAAMQVAHPDDMDEYGLEKLLPNSRMPPTMVINVIGDGNCFYHAISRAITGDNDNHHVKLRNLLAKFVEANMEKEVFKNKLGSREDLVDEITSNQYAGEEEFQWMAEMLGVRISVFYRSADPNVQYGADENRPYQWFTFSPIRFLRYPRGGQLRGQNVDEDATIYLYFCGPDLKQYSWPNHFAVVTHV